MKSYNAILLLLTMCFFVHVKGKGQNIVNLTHVMQRGETIENLADKYMLSVDILKKNNWGNDFYTGMPILVPVDKKYLWLRSEEDGERILADIAGYFAEYKNALHVFNSGNYKKAKELFDTTIRNHGKYLPCEEAYFAKAMCDYNRKKWTSAIDGFTEVINIEGCSDDLREKCRGLRDVAKNKRANRNQRTAAILGGIFQTAAEVGTVYMAQSQSNAGFIGNNSTSLSTGRTFASMSDAELNNYVNTSLTQIANYSVMQVEQQWRQEEMQLRTLFVSTYRQMHGRNPSEQEIQANYNDYMMKKANAYKTAQEASSGMYDKELGISKKSSVKTSGTSSDKSCYSCHGIKKCWTCNGARTYRNPLNGQYVKCPNCTDGLCHVCHGTGRL